MRFILVSFLTLLTSPAFCQSLTDEIDRIYNFQPSKLSEKEQENKVPQLDGFWNKIKSDTATYLPRLREELQRDRHNPYFYYDAGGLLLSLTNNKSDKALAVNAMAKCDLADINQKLYVQTLNNLANEGIEVTKPALKILGDDEYSFFIPQHVLTFSQEHCLMYMLLPQKNTGYVDTLISIFKSQKGTAQKSILTTLWFAYSCKGDAFLKSVVQDRQAPKDVRDHVKKLLNDTQLSKDQAETLKMIGDGDVETVRSNALKRFSDEALEELVIATVQMRKETQCR